MKILFLSRSDTGAPHAFVKEQADVLRHTYGFVIGHFLIGKGGIKGYLKAIAGLSRYLLKNQVTIVHVHYGLWTMVAVISKYLLLKRFKIIVTYHGSDIFKDSERRISTFASLFVSWNILVTDRMSKYFSKNFSVIPCGINTGIPFEPQDTLREELGWMKNDFVVLFASGFDRKVKDPAFAFEVIKNLEPLCSKTVRFIELKGYSREELTRLMQAADALLMCSRSEGSPQVIKEAILNRLPVVSNDVGDVKFICNGIDNTFILPKESGTFVNTLHALSVNPVRINNRELLLAKFDNKIIAENIFGVYSGVLKYTDLFDSGFSMPLAFDITK